MKKRFLDKVKDNAAVRIWSKKTQQEKGDSLTEGYMSELWDFTHISKRVDVFTLSIYRLVILPKVLGHIDDAVSELFDRFDKRVTPVKVKKVSYRVFFENYSPLKEFVATPRRDSVPEGLSGWVKHQKNGDKKSKKKKLELISGKRNFKILEFEKML
ncbi:hypothetical protein Gotri_004764 [Gossypium trilobum]|uniref:Uncharacterized protein n=1 Tax=Gossypium trilobum TaxID=34281 RepID=A0A7J9F697_9ROSI|nr:hypothetical protein [Gossypium trilobum]